MGQTGPTGFTGPTGPTVFQQNVFFNSGGALNSGSFIRFGSQSSLEANSQFAIGLTGSINRLRVILGTGPGTGASRTFTVNKNSVATPLTVTISGTSTSGTDVVDTVIVNTDDLISVLNTSVGNAIDSTGIATFIYNY
jgi:hypothetical protein